MSGLATLIRLARQDLDERRRALSELMAMQAQMEGRLGELDAQTQHEREVAASVEEVRSAYPAYAITAREKRQRITAAIEGVKAEVDKARAAMAEQFETVKRFELAAEARAAAAAERERVRESALLDDVALDGFRRRQEEEDGE